MTIMKHYVTTCTKKGEDHDDKWQWYGRDDLRKGRGDHAKEDHHVEADEPLGGEHHRVELSISKGHIPAVQMWQKSKGQIQWTIKDGSHSHDVDALNERSVFRVSLRPRVAHMFQKVDKSWERKEENTR